MRSFLLLLLLSLTTGCEAMSEVKGCQEGWVEFTCNYPQSNGKYESIDVVTPKTETIQSTKKDVWENKGRLSLYRDTKKKQLRVAIKQLEREDFGDYKCTFYPRHKSTSNTEKLELEVETVGCQTPFVQTAYRTAKTTITCDYSGNKYKFFCKDNGFICEDILSTKSSPKSNGTFTLTETNSNFSMSISNVASHDAGVYWCGVEEKRGSYRGALRKIHLQVEDITTFKRSPTVGQTFTYWCRYPNGAPIKKFICKGEDPSTCRPLINTIQLNKNTGKFSIKDDKVKQNVTITVREVTTDDTGTYWCGAESSDETRSNPFYHRFLMTVVSSTSSTSPVSSTQSTAASDDNRGGSQVVITVIVCVAVLLLLLFVPVLILIYKRCSLSKNTRNGAAAQHIKEDYVYEEIKERVQKPDSGNAVNTIYDFPTNPSASLLYSTISFHNSSDRAGGGALILKPSSATCEYSTVKYSQTSPTYSTVNQPPRSSEDPLYSTVNHPQQQ